MLQNFIRFQNYVYYKLNHVWIHILTIFKLVSRGDAHGSSPEVLSQPSSVTSSLPKCPVCELEFDYVDLTEHIDVCLRTYNINEEESNCIRSEEENDVDVENMGGFETYTWAGQTRIRSTTLIDGGLRGAGFLTITKGDEDQVWKKINLRYYSSGRNIIIVP